MQLSMPGQLSPVITIVHALLGSASQTLPAPSPSVSVCFVSQEFSAPPQSASDVHAVAGSLRQDPVMGPLTFVWQLSSQFVSWFVVQGLSVVNPELSPSSNTPSPSVSGDPAPDVCLQQI